MALKHHLARRTAHRAWLAGLWLAALAAGGGLAAQAGGGQKPTEPAQPTRPATEHAPGVPQPADAAPVVAEAEPDSTSAPVIFRGELLWRVHASLGPFSAEERARSIETRLNQLARDTDIGVDELTLVHETSVSRVLLRGRVIGIVTDEDAAAARLPRREYAERILADVKRVISKTRAEFTAGAIGKSLLGAVLATLALAALAAILASVFRRSLQTLQRWGAQPSQRAPEARLPRLARRQMALLGAPLLRLVRLVSFVSLALIWLEVVLAALPWTRPYARRVMDYVEEPIRFAAQGFLDALPDFFYLFVIALIAYYVLRVVRFFFLEVERGSIRFPSFPAEWAPPTYRLVRVLLVALAVVAAYPYIPGSSSPAFQGISVFLGLLISLSSSAAIGNIVSGTVLTYTGGFRLGDRVRIGDTVGDIVETSMLVTKIRTIKNVVVSIPNAVVLSSPMVNYSALARQDGLILHTGVTIGYDAPWRQVHELLLAAARRTPGIVESPAPFVLQTALNDFYVAYEINAYTREPRRMVEIYSDLHASIQDAFNEAGVEIMSPHYASLRDGNRIAIPDGYVAPDYEARSFRIAGSPPERRP